jgi:hypothetical protein
MCYHWWKFGWLEGSVERVELDSKTKMKFREFACLIAACECNKLNTLVGSNM